MEMIKTGGKIKNIIPFRMELTEAAVTALVDYLYTGEIHVESDINTLINLAIAAHCFQLQESFIIMSSSRLTMIFCTGNH